jgi:hypothetical protein
MGVTPSLNDGTELGGTVVDRIQAVAARSRLIGIGVALSLLILGWGPGRAAAATLDVCPNGCAYSQIAPALTAAQDGDTVRVGAGTYVGGFAISRSIDLVGAGAGATIIEGGGPVVTIGTFGATTEPTVSIRSVTITGGVSRRTAESFGDCQLSAFGGGVEIAPNARYNGGATVTIADSDITGNSAEVSDAADGLACSGGGGIDNWGTVSLSNTTVGRNEAGGKLASRALGGGLLNWGTMSLSGSTVSGNVAITSGQYSCDGNATGGGIVSYYRLTVSGGAIRDNVVELSSSKRSPDCGTASGGGVRIHNGTASIVGTTIEGNRASATSRYGYAGSFGGGIAVDVGTLTLRDSEVSGNQSTATASTTGGVANPTAGGIGVGYPCKVTISNTSITDNVARASAPAGAAVAEGGGMQTTDTVLSDSVVSGNSVLASSSTGSASVHGAGIQHGNGTLRVSDTTISGNSGAADAPSGDALGGGIWNDAFFPPPPSPRLTLVNTVVTDNTLAGSPGVAVHGGGMYTTFTAVLMNGSAISGNTPDDCFGACG